MGDDRPERVWSAPPSCYYLEEPSTSDDDATRPCSTASCDDAILLNTFQYSYSERVIRLAVTILHDFQAIPIRVKILLDKLLTTVSEDELVYMLHQSGWTWLDYCRGYKTEVGWSLDPSPGSSLEPAHVLVDIRLSVNDALSFVASPVSREREIQQRATSITVASPKCNSALFEDKTLFCKKL